MNRFLFHIFAEFLKVQALKDQQVEAGKSKTAFALHQKQDDHFMKEVMKIISFWDKLSALINSMISIVGNISEKKLADLTWCNSAYNVKICGLIIPQSLREIQKSRQQ